VTGLKKEKRVSGISRRAFGGTVAAAMAGPICAKATLTAGEAIERILSKLEAEGVERRQRTTDTFKIGDPSTPLTGIATTFQATFEVMKRAAAAKKNLILSHESLFWGDFPAEAAARSQDPVYHAKRRFAEQNNLLVWRFHDHWHSRRPDPIFDALTRQLGWESCFQPGPEGQHSGAQSAYDLPETTLGAVARHVRDRLGTRNVRVVGDPKMKVKRVSNSVHWLPQCLVGLRTADVVMVGETGELDTMEYVRDATSLGMPKGLIVISHNMLEEWGMRAAAVWLTTLFPEAPVEFIPSREPYWMVSGQA
jgi:putative NIF3 family GTP cyclohydrolase 1 type 2